MPIKANIKLVIDQLQGMERQVLSSDEIAIFNATDMLETLGRQVAAQAAVIAKLRDALRIALGNQVAAQAALIEKLRDALRIAQSEIASGPQDLLAINGIQKALAIPTDSKQILAEWLDSALGEPIGYADSYGKLLDMATKKFGKGVLTSWYSIPLFKKPDIE